MSLGTKSNVSSKIQNLGFVPIPPIYMQKNVKSCLKWINHFSSLFQIKSFPYDLIDDSAKNLFEFLQIFLV